LRGAVMKVSGKKADPKMVGELLEKKLNAWCEGWVDRPERAGTFGSGGREAAGLGEDFVRPGGSTHFARAKCRPFGPQTTLVVIFGGLTATATKSSGPFGPRRIRWRKSVWDCSHLEKDHVFSLHSGSFHLVNSAAGGKDSEGMEGAVAWVYSGDPGE
jgi:hypothetical protein